MAGANEDPEVRRAYCSNDGPVFPQTLQSDLQATCDASTYLKDAFARNLGMVGGSDSHYIAYHHCEIVTINLYTNRLVRSD